jgi:hypothetical protein
LSAFAETLVASLYPIGIDLAGELAAGKPIEGVTWDVVAEMNAKHTTKHACISKQEAIEPLRSNSPAAA